MKFSYTRYPIDKQELFIAFEDLLYDDRYVELKYDKDSNYSPKVSLPKFHMREKITRSVDSPQKTTYGLGGIEPTYSRVEIGLVIERKVSYFVVKVLPPIFITLITAIVAFSIDPIRSFERLYVIPGSVLSLVFLQIGFSAETPDGGSMTVTDWVFNWWYVLFLKFNYVLPSSSHTSKFQKLFSGTCDVVGKFSFGFNYGQMGCAKR